MNIDFYISSLGMGGAERVLVTLAKEMSMRGNTVSVTNLDKLPQYFEVPESAAYFKYSNKGKGKLRETFSDFTAVRRQLKKRKDTDLCVCFLNRCNLLVPLAALGLGRRIAVCDRNNPLMEHSRMVFRLSCMIYRLADAVFVQTEEIRRMYPEYLQKKMYVIENPVDAAGLEAQLTRSDYEKKNTMISVGRLVPQKDHETMFRAFAKVSDAFPEWKLELWGAGELQNSFEQLIHELGMEDRIFLKGRTGRIYEQLKQSSIFVLSSHFEGFPNALCEAMHAGLPCIASNCVSGPAELIDDGISGYLVPVGDVDTMAERMKSLMADASLREQMGKNASEAVKRLDSDVITEKWIKAFREVTKAS